MLQPYLDLAKKYLAPDILGRWGAFVVGIGRDFWKDPHPDERESMALDRRMKKEQRTREKQRQADQKKKDAAEKKKNKEGSKNKKKLEDDDSLELVSVDRIMLLETMWGVGEVLPGGDELREKMVMSLGLNSSMNVLDLSAGLGGFARHLAEEYDAYVTGFEENAELVKRGHEMSMAAGKIKQADIEFYDPLSFKTKRLYDCIIVRELFYRVIGKTKLFTAIGSSLKPRGQIVFTDYVLDPALRENRAVAAWLAYETSATPFELVETRQTWKKMNYDVRVNEDLTEFYKAEIKKGIIRLAAFLKTADLNQNVKRMIAKELATWTYRLGAFENGLKFCRFHVIKI